MGSAASHSRLPSDDELATLELGSEAEAVREMVELVLIMKLSVGRAILEDRSFVRLAGAVALARLKQSGIFLRRPPPEQPGHTAFLAIAPVGPEA